MIGNSPGALPVKVEPVDLFYPDAVTADDEEPVDASKTWVLGYSTSGGFRWIDASTLP